MGRGTLGATTELPVTGVRGRSSEGEPPQPTAGPAGRTGVKANYRTPRKGRSGTERRRQKSVQARLKPARATPVEVWLMSALRRRHGRAGCRKHLPSRSKPVSQGSRCSPTQERVRRRSTATQLSNPLPGGSDIKRNAHPIPHAVRVRQHGPPVKPILVGSQSSGQRRPFGRTHLFWKTPEYTALLKEVSRPRKSHTRLSRVVTEGRPMRVTNQGTTWIHRLWLNADDLSRVARGNLLETELPNNVSSPLSWFHQPNQPPASNG
jgi:hypothetical protein